MSLFVDNTHSLINLEIYYIETLRKHGHSVFQFIQSAEDFETWKNKGYSFESTDKKINKLVVTMKRLTWKEHNSVVSRSLQYNMGPDQKLFTRMDPVLYRELKLKTALKKWDALDDKGNPIEPTSDIIDSLAPEVAQAILDAYEKVTEISETDSKK